MFAYGAVNVAAAFRAVPLDVRLTFHTALMSSNAVVMQAAMAGSIIACVILAALLAGRARALAITGAVLGIATFIITRLGNVPINRMIREWITSSLPADYAMILARWELFHYARTATAVLMFICVVVAVGRFWARPRPQTHGSASADLRSRPTADCIN